MTYQVQSGFLENYDSLYSIVTSDFSLTTTYQTVQSSLIDYTPSQSSSSVVYQFCVYFGRTNTSATRTNFYAKLQYSDDDGSTWSDWGDNTECYIGSYGTYARPRTVAEVKFALDTTGWTSSKKLRLQAKKHLSDSNTGFHKLQDFYDENGLVSGDSFFNPSVSCYSVE